MIDHISIKNFATIKDAEIDFEDGLNSVTGETGAGKSIVVEAISLALGSRADSSYVRHGEEKAEIELLADIQGSQHVISREINSSGKNICRIDSHIATLQDVQRYAHEIADIHGQYDNQLLLDPDHHLGIVDSYSHEKISPIKSAYLKSYEEYKSVRSEYDELISNASDNERKQDFYSFQINEINTVDPKPGEDSELEDRISLLQNSEAVFTALSRSKAILNDEDPGVITLLGELQTSLGSISKYSDKIKDLSQRLDSAAIEIEEISNELSSMSDIADFSPEDLDSAISRLEDINELKKKYGPEIQDVLDFRDNISEELSKIENFDDEKKRLTDKLNACRAALMEKASVLTEVRKESASRLAEAISAELKDLNFDGSSFEIRINKAPAVTRGGQDEAEILISANPGEPVKPLSKIASGGEISRVMLAIKNVIAGYDEIPTMIFDEIDSGISGVTASVVARKLLEIARNHQIICITHLPQIAAAGSHNFRISKETDAVNTYTHVDKLDQKEKTREIARLLGGDNITENTIKSSMELIAGYDSLR